MVSLIITEKGGQQTVRQFNKEEISVGRVQGNDVVLPKSNISKKHAHIIKSNSSYVLHDDKSTNGTYVNGKRINGPYDLHEGDKIYLGDFILELQDDESSLQEIEIQESIEDSGISATEESIESNDILIDEGWGGENKRTKEEAVWSEEKDESSWGMEPSEQSSPKKVLSSAPKKGSTLDIDDDDGLADLNSEVEEEIIPQQTTTEGRARFADSKIREVAKSPSVSEKKISPKKLVGIGEWGPVEPLLHDDAIREVHINHDLSVFIRRHANMKSAAEPFTSSTKLSQLIDYLCRTHHANKSDASIEIKIDDNLRVSIIQPPLVAGPCLSVYKITYEQIPVDDLVANGVMSANMAEFLEFSVQHKRNIIVCGKPGAGKSTTLGVLGSLILENERIVVLQDHAHIKLDQPNVIYLNAPKNMESMAHILNQIHPERLLIDPMPMILFTQIVGGLKGLYSGTLMTLEAYAPVDALSQMTMYLLQHAPTLNAAEGMLMETIDLIVYETCSPEGTRRIQSISQPSWSREGRLDLETIFHYETDKQLKRGQFRASRVVPRFYEQLSQTTNDVNLSLFSTDD